MATVALERLRNIKTLPQLVSYLRDELDWPVDQDAVEDDLTFDYSAEELGFDAATAVHIKEIKQLRPLDARQPWGVFWVNFEKKRLPVVMLRRILGHLVLKKRVNAKRASQRAWHLHDLLFISAYGEESDRAITFAHFSQPPDSPGDLPVLKVLGWDDGDAVLHLVEAHRTLAEKLRWPAKSISLEDWRNQWASAFTLRHREVITTTNQLVEELARLADATRRRARTILARESERGPLRRLYAAFKAALIHDLTEDDFADVIAQTISYGLLIARFSRAAISAQNLVDMVPATNPFLRELLGTLLALAGRQSAFDFDELGIQDVVEVLNRSNADAVKADFGNRTRDEDPVIHFYEHFLAAYDRQKKIQRGVFYTPQPAVSYIVRSVHELLQKEFGIEDGLASTITWGDMLKRHPDLKLPKIRVPKAGKAEGEEVDLSPDEFFVLILDIATGTGTFLVETIEVIFQHLKARWKKGGLAAMPVIRHSALRLPHFKDYWNAYVPAALLPRLYGYELMMAPYTIAHMKLALKFSEINARLGQTDYLFKFDGRAHIYLTNTLEPPSNVGQQQLAGLFPALAHEAAAVNTVKRTKRFTVVIGNPPYSVSSRNKSEFIESLMDLYKLDVRHEPNIKPLSDDYAKFFRFAHSLGAMVPFSVIGLITNNSFLWGPTFLGMRKRLMADFALIHLMNLHGDSLSGETNPDGGKDENVFDIRQGVVISILVRSPQSAEKSSPKSYDLYGSRESKYRALAEKRDGLIKWDTIPLKAPGSPFIVTDATNEAEYQLYPSLTAVLPTHSKPILTKRDHITIHLDRESLLSTLNDLVQLSHSDFIAKYGLEADSRDWTYASAKKTVASFGIKDAFIQPVNYRPFDKRWTYYVNKTKGFMAYPVYGLLGHMLKPNLGLCIPRQINQLPWRHVLAVGGITEFCYISNQTREANDVFTLYSYEEASEQGTLDVASHRRPNLSSSFLKSLSTALGLAQAGAHGLPAGLTPEDIFHYAYGVFHSPGYRSRYAQFLKTEFPRLPLTGNLELFRALARLGSELVALHLLESPKLAKPRTKFIGGRDPEVEKVSWSKNTVWIDKAQTTGFRGVPESVWNFHIGGYQVCEKWLKDRKGRTLSKDDIAHYHKIVVALAETIRLMAEIDKVIEKHGGWPGAFAVSGSQIPVVIA
jgi:predicted helicase